MQFLSDFADLAVILPLAFAVGIGAALLGWRRGAAAWALAVAATWLGVGGLKLLFGGCDLDVPGLISPSGHTASAAVVYGGLLAWWLRRRGAALPRALAAAGVVACAVGVSRLALRVHSVADVLAGGAVGLAGVAVLWRAAGPVPPGLRAGRLLLVAALAVAVLHGRRLRAEPDLRWASMYLSYAGVCDALGVPARAATLHQAAGVSRVITSEPERAHRRAAVFLGG